MKKNDKIKTDKKAAAALADKQVAPEFAPVVVTSGKLTGMTFTPGRWIPLLNGSIAVRYVAPNEGPASIVRHNKQGGEYSETSKAEDVRITFSKFITANILWNAESGYSDKISGDALKWSYQLGRFVVNDKAVTPIADPVPPVSEIRNEDEEVAKKKEAEKGEK